MTPRFGPIFYSTDDKGWTYIRVGQHLYRRDHFRVWAGYILCTALWMWVATAVVIGSIQ